MDQEKHRAARSSIHRLTSAATPAALSSALSDLRLLSKQDPDIRPHLADSGLLVPLLANLLLHDAADNDFAIREGVDQENASATLLNISISAPEALMSCASLLPALSRALRGPPALAQHAAATLHSLLRVESYRPIIGSKRDLIISPLLSLLKGPNSPTRSIKDSLKALFGLALYPLNRAALVELGAVPALCSLVVRDGRAGIVEDASAVIAQVAGCSESVEEFRKYWGVEILVNLAEEGSERAKENAASGLLNLVMSGGERAAGDVREVEGMQEVLKGLERMGSARARGKAEELLRVLEMIGGRGRRRSWDRDLDEDERFSDWSTARSSSSGFSGDTNSFYGAEMTN